MKNAYLDELCSVLLRLQSQEAILEVLRDLLTPQEIASVAERVQIFKRLHQGIPQRKISEDLGVSISKVIRGAHAYKISRGIVPKLK